MSSRGARTLAALPVLVPVFFACLGVVCTALLLLESFSGPVALLLAAVLTAGAVALLGVGDGQLSRRAVALDLAALALALGFAGFQGAFASEDLVVTRDPGVYTVTAAWLTDHSNVDIDTQARLFGTQPGVTYPSAGFGPTAVPDHVYSQGAHVLPAVLAVVGSFVGDDLMLRTNALLGGLALLAAYGLGRRLVGRGAALAAVGLVALTLPELAFSRDAYTEPYSQLLVLGGLALLWRARPERLTDWALAGLVLGSSCLARIDAYLVLPFVVGYAGLRLALAPAGERRRTALQAVALLTAAGGPALLGWLDLTRLSSGYYRDLRGQFLSLMTLLVVATAGTAVAVVLAWTTPVVGWLRSRELPWWTRVGNVAALLVVVAGVLLAARPLVHTSHGITDKPQQLFIADLQGIEKSTIDPTRSYAEQTVTWLAWYLGPIAVAAALFGIALLVRRTLARRDLAAVPFLLVLLSTSGLYLVNPSITPDQVWALRRFVPIVLPGAALGAMYALGLLLARLTGRRRQLATAAVVLALVAPVLFITKPFVRVKEGSPQLAEVRRVCAALPDNAAVLVVGFFAARYPMTVRTFCDVPTVAQPMLDVARARLAVTELARSGRQLYVLSADDVAKDLPVEPGAGAMRPVSSVDVRSWVRALKTPPRQAPPQHRDLFLGRVGASGTVASWVAP